MLFKIIYQQTFPPGPQGNRLWSPGFCIQGQAYHSIGTLFPTSQNQEGFLQIYFLDNADQNRRRNSIFEGLNPSIIQTLTREINLVNPFVHELRHAVTFIRQQSLPSLKVTLNSIS